MSEEIKNDNSKDVQSTQVDEKQSTKTFTQSEHDQALATIEKKIKDQYKDYDDVTKKLTKLEKEKKDKQLEEASEIEKRDIQLKDLTEKIESLTNDYSKEKLKNMRNDIFSDARFTKLPRAYRNLVALSESKDEMIESANEVLKEFDKDFGRKDNFGGPITTKDIKPGDNGAKTMAQKIKESLIKKSSIGTKSPLGRD